MNRDCVDCGGAYVSGHRVTCARGLCPNCYQRHQRHGTLADFERLTYSGTELLAEWDLLRREGHTRAQAAERLGIKRKRLEKAIERARLGRAS